MSIIQGQTIRFSIVNYLATVLAAISTLWIYPLELHAYGLAQFLVSISALGVPLAILGTAGVVVKFFPEYKAQGLKDSFLFNALVLGVLTMVVALVLALLIHRPVLKFLDLLYFNAQLIARHKFAIVVLVGIMAYNSVLIAHASNYNRIAIPTAFQNLLPKFILPGLILALYLQVTDLSMYAKLWVVSFALASIGLTLYLRYIDGLDIRPRPLFFQKDRLKKLLRYSWYTGTGNVGVLLVGKMDVIMVGTLLGLKATGVYSIALFIGNTLLIPATGIWQIASPEISRAFENKQFDRISEIYKKTSANLLIYGILAYFGILGVLDPVLTFSPNYADIVRVGPLFALIGIARLIDMGASVNHYILMYSQYYRSVLVFTVIMGVVNLALGYLFIVNLGILGAAIAMCVTVYLHHLLKYYYIAKRLGIHPFSQNTPRIALLFAVMLVYYLVFPQVGSPVIQAIVYVIGLLVIYIGGIRLLGIRSDATETFDRLTRRAIAWVQRRT